MDRPSFEPVNYTVAITETGLYAGTNWSVSLGSTRAYSFEATIDFFEPNGSYTYDAAPLTGYTLQAPNGSVVVAGSPANVTITFRSIAGPRTLTNVTVGRDPGASALAVGDGGNGWLYVSDNLSNDVTVLNGSAPIATIPVGTAPGEELYDAFNGYVYVVNTGSDNVSVISGDTVVGTIRVGSHPCSVVLGESPPGPPVTTAYVYVANFDSGNVTVISNLTVIATVRVGQSPVAMTVDDQNGEIYVANYGSGNVSVIDGTKLAATVSISGHPFSILSDPSNEYVYVVGAGYANVTIIDGNTVLSTIAAPGQGDNVLVYDWENEGVYVLTQGTPAPNYGNASDVSRIVGTQLIGTVELPGAADWAVDDQSNGLFYVSAGQIYIVDGQTIIDTIRLGGSLYSGPLTFDPLSGDVYSSDLGTSAVSTTETIIAPAPYSINFAESGLPPGSVWSVDLAGVARSASGSSNDFLGVSNGSYEWSVTASGCQADPPYGTAVVDGSNVSVAITFGSPGCSATYPVGFNESGLPASASWTIDLNGSTASSTGTHLVFDEPNGTYPYSVANSGNYSPKPSSGSVVVAGKAISTSIAFSYNSSKGPARYNLTFQETGLANGTFWSVEVNGSSSSSSATGIVFSEANGTYSWGANATANGSSETIWGNTTVSGSAVAVNVSFSAPSPLAPLEFEETGLPAATNWSVTLTASSAGLRIESGISFSRFAVGVGSIRFEVTPGTYSYEAEAASYAAINGTVRVTASGNPTVRIAFSASEPGGPPNPNGLRLSGSTLGVGLAVLLIGFIGIAATFFHFGRRRRAAGRALVTRLAETDWDLEEASAHGKDSR